MRKLIGIFSALLMLLPLAALADGNAVSNGDFSVAGEDGLPEAWYADAWYRDGVSSFALSGDGYEGGCALLYSGGENDARFAQDVEVEPDTLYRLSCRVRAEGCGEDTRGANLSVKNTYCYSESVWDTDGEWVTLELYGRTGISQTVLTVWLRIGGYSSLNTGRAWFDDVTVEAVDAIPAGAVENDFTDMTGSSSDDAADTEKTDVVPKRYTPAWLLLTGVYLLAVLACARKRGENEIAPAPRKILFAAILAGALLIRVALALTVRGHYFDINCFTLWSERMADVGPFAFYEDGYFCDYPPLYMLILSIPSFLRQLLRLETFSAGHILLIKLLPILLDLTAAYLVYRVAEKRVGGKAACLLGAFLAFNPALIIDSAAWGQIDIVFTLPLVLAALLLVDKKYATALPLFVIACLIKPQALLYAPLGLLSLVTGLKEKSKRREAAIGVGVSLGLIYLTAALVTAGQPGFTPFTPVTWIVDKYRGTFGGYDYMTLNSCNLYELLGLNWAPTQSHQALYIVAWVLFWLSYLYSGFLMLASRRRSVIFLAAGILCALLFALGPMMHERYLFPAVILLAVAYCYDRDKRLLAALAVLSACLFLNQVLVLQGALTDSNYGHLQSSEDWLNCAISLVVVADAVYLAILGLDIAVFRHVHPLSAPKAPPAEKKSVNYKLALKKFDYLAMAIVTVVYSVVAFVNLGATSAPENGWTSDAAGEQITFDLGESRDFHMTYYGGICNSNFTVEFSQDGESWSDGWYADYSQGEVFRWKWFAPLNADNTRARGTDGAVRFSTGSSDYPMQTARFVRVTSRAAGLILYEVAFLDADGEPLPVTADSAGGQALTDEQDTVPAYPSYYNSTYFDEIYHARTAFEQLHGLDVYEWTHPPLGKVLMMVGISIFGMCPFGWRFMGCLVGCLMLPVMYLLAKQLTGSRKLSLLSMFLLAVDAMHFTQTRIATIDSYAVFWIMLEYLFMFRYEKMMRAKADWRRALIPLALSGLMMGFACATKWIGIYSAAGLAAIFFYALIRRIAEEAKGGLPGKIAVRRTALTLLLCVGCFIVIPCLIYYGSYWWQMQAEGGLTVQRVVELQKSIFRYHAGLGSDTHYFRSDWYEWPVIWWPMWYFSGTEFMPDGVISSISCMGNPAVWWTGLAALLSILFLSAWRRKTPENWKLILIGFASQYLPWVLVPRSTFIYHYFASVPFLILSIAAILGEVRQRDKKAFRIASIALAAAALLLFVAFYPLESGTPVARSYAQYLRWFSWYNY